MPGEPAGDITPLSLGTAQRLVRAVVRDADAPSLACAVVDRGGHLLALERTATTPFLTARIAESKARASALLGRPTSETAARAVEVPHLYGTLAALSDGPMLHVAGGVPIRVRGVIVGAIGVSGGVPDDDEAMARAALEAVGPT